MFLRCLKACIFLSFFSSISQVCEAIIAGRTAEPGQFPYAVALYRDVYICSASIITPDTLLTAAHCIVTNGVLQPASDFYGVVGAVNRLAPSKVNFKEVIPHPNYDEKTVQNDIAVMKLENPLTFNMTVNAICLADTDTDLNEYKVAVAMGWGDIKIGRETEFPEKLMYIKQEILPFKFCEKQLNKVFRQNRDQKKRICTIEDRSNDVRVEGICSGDSGGPLVHLPKKDAGVPIQIGVASFGKERCGVYVSASARVSAYIDFIREHAPGICTKERDE